MTRISPRTAWLWAVLAILLSTLIASLAIRDYQLGTAVDDAYYTGGAWSIAHGQGYRQPWDPQNRPQDVFPPVTSLLIAPVCVGSSHPPLSLIPWWMLALSTASAVACAWLYRSTLGAAWSYAAGVALLVLSPGWLLGAVKALSEFPFVGLLAIAFALTSRLTGSGEQAAQGTTLPKADRPGNRVLLAMGIGAALGAATLARAPGVAAVAAVSFYLLARGFRRELVVMWGVLGAFLGAWLIRNVLLSGSAMETGHGIHLSRISLQATLDNLKSYWTVVPDAFLYVLRSDALLGLPGGKVVIALAAAGFWAAAAYAVIKARLCPLALFSLLYLALLMVWPLTQDAPRLTMPVVPFLLVLIIRAVPSRVARLAPVAVAALIGVGLLITYRNLRVPFRTYGRDVAAGADWLRDATTADEVIAGDFPPVLWLRTGRKCVRVVDAESLRAARDQYRVRFVVSAPSSFGNRNSPPSPDPATLSDLALVWEDVNTHTRIYQVQASSRSIERARRERRTIPSQL